VLTCARVIRWKLVRWVGRKFWERTNHIADSYSKSVLECSSVRIDRYMLSTTEDKGDIRVRVVANEGTG